MEQLDYTRLMFQNLSIKMDIKITKVMSNINWNKNVDPWNSPGVTDVLAPYISGPTLLARARNKYQYEGQNVAHTGPISGNIESRQRRVKVGKSSESKWWD